MKFPMVAALFAVCFSAASASGPLRVHRLLRVIDGDTFVISLASYAGPRPRIPEVLGDSLPVRIWGVDAPELRAADPWTRSEGQRARRFTDSVLARAKRITLVNVRRDKYFRLLAEVRADTLDVGAALLRAGLAKPYFGGTRSP